MTNSPMLVLTPLKENVIEHLSSNVNESESIIYTDVSKMEKDLIKLSEKKNGEKIAKKDRNL